MIEFYRTRKCAFCDEVEARLKQLVLAHRIHIGHAGDSDVPMPVLVEGKRHYANRDEITFFLDEISREMTIQREMQSDSCKIDPDGGGCL